MANLLNAAGVSLEDVRVESLKGTVFYAIAKIKLGDKVIEVDARPSDAINLALQMDRPIYVAETVMAEYGLDISEKETFPELRALKDMKAKYEAQEAEREAVIARKKQESEGLSEAEKAEREKQKQQEILALVFGDAVTE